MSTVEPVLTTTWQKRPPENCGHANSVPSIRGFKCTECVLENATTWEMRIADTGGRPKASIQPGKSDHIRQIKRKTLFQSSSFSLAGTPDERSSRLQAWLAHGRCQLRPRVHVGTTDRWWRWLVQGHVYKSILKKFEPNLPNETVWEIGPLIPSPFGGRNSQVWL